MLAEPSGNMCNVTCHEHRIELNVVRTPLPNRLPLQPPLPSVCQAAVDSDLGNGPVITSSTLRQPLHTGCTEKSCSMGLVPRLYVRVGKYNCATCGCMSYVHI